MAVSGTDIQAAGTQPFQQRARNSGMKSLRRTFPEICGPACKRDPVSGVIGFQKAAWIVLGAIYVAIGVDRRAKGTLLAG